MFQTWAVPRVTDEWEHIDEVTAQPWLCWTGDPWSSRTLDQDTYERAGRPRPRLPKGGSGERAR